jgi:hypothetical protein
MCVRHDCIPVTSHQCMNAMLDVVHDFAHHSLLVISCLFVTKRMHESFFEECVWPL